MSEEQSMQQIILDTANKIFTDLCDKTPLDAAEAELSETLWRQVRKPGSISWVKTAVQRHRIVCVHINSRALCGTFASGGDAAGQSLVRCWRRCLQHWFG